MKFRINLYVMVTGIVTCSLFASGFACWSYSGFGESWHLVALVCCILGAMGTIWIGWYWLKLAGAIAFLTGQLKQEHPTHIKTGSNKILNELSKGINNCLAHNADYITELEKEIKKLQIRIQILQRQKRNIETIIYSIRDVVVVVESGRLLMANEAAEKLFKLDFNDSKNKPVEEVINADKSEFVEFLRQSEQNKVQHTRHEIKFSEGKSSRTFDCIVSCIPAGADMTEPATARDPALREAKAGVYGVVAVLHDITREKEVSQMKNDFISHVSHELRTPLASITAYSEMLLDGEANDEQTMKEFCLVIQSQAARLNRLIEDILNTARIESGLIKVDKQPVSLTILIEEQLQMIKSYAEEKNIEIIGRKPIVFEQVYADKDMISQVIVNLLSNAVKYTKPGGSIKVETEVDEIAHLVRVSVTDTGVGIPENELQYVFDKFYRVGANKSQAKGTGLGLNLVKQIVERVHNGRVFVTSQVGVGSTFGFELPLATAEVAERV